MPTAINGLRILNQHYKNIYNKNNLVIIERKPQYESGKDIYISPYRPRAFNFQQLFFYDIFLQNAYFTSYRSSKYTTVN